MGLWPLYCFALSYGVQVERLYAILKKDDLLSNKMTEETNRKLINDFIW
jgi:hypothetical protein